MDLHELAWASGFFDGEGSASVSQKKHPSLVVVQADRETLVRFQQAVGTGSIYLRKKIKGQIGRKLLWVWKVSAYEQVQYVTCLLWPRLSSPKRKQIVRMIGTVHAFKFRNGWDKRSSLQKLTKAQVREIHHRVVAGEKGLDLAKEYTVSRATISNIKHGKRCYHYVPTEANLPILEAQRLRSEGDNE